MGVTFVWFGWNLSVEYWLCPPMEECFDAPFFWSIILNSFIACLDFCVIVADLIICQPVGGAYIEWHSD